MMGMIVPSDKKGSFKISVDNFQEFEDGRIEAVVDLSGFEKRTMFVVKKGNKYKSTILQ
jgi:hypothetical protein